MERVGSEAGDESWLVLTGDTTPLHWWLIASVDNQIQRNRINLTVLYFIIFIMTGVFQSEFQ